MHRDPDPGAPVPLRAVGHRDGVEDERGRHGPGHVEVVSGEENTVRGPVATTEPPVHAWQQEAAEEELLVRLVALNQQRATEEKMGVVHWLRPEFQRPRLYAKVKGEMQVEADLGEAAVVEDAKWPADGLDQIRSVRDLLARTGSPVSVPALSAAFGGRNTPKRRQRVEQVLDILVSTGAVRRDEGTGGYYLPR